MPTRSPRQIVHLKPDTLAVILQRQVLGDIAFIAQAEDLGEPIRFNVQSAVQVVRLGGSPCKLGVIAFDEARKERIAIIHVGDACNAQFFDEPILQRPVRAFDTALCLARIGADDLDVQLGQGTPKLGHAGHVFVGLRNAEHGVLVAIESNGATVFEQIAFQGLEIAEGALRCDKTQFHQGAGRIIDEDEQGAGIAAFLKPPVIRAVDLDQLAEAFPTQPRLVECPALLA